MTSQALLRNFKNVWWC